MEGACQGYLGLQESLRGKGESRGMSVGHDVPISSPGTWEIEAGGFTRLSAALQGGYPRLAYMRLCLEKQYSDKRKNNCECLY